MLAVILIGHGGVPRDFPREDLLELKRLEGARRARGESRPGERERALDARIRGWPRGPENDPSSAGLASLAAALGARLDPTPVFVAYNEFCAPSLEDALDQALGAGATRVVVVPTMITPGGSHSEEEIPEILERARRAHPGLELRYAWPYSPERLAELFLAQIAATTGAR